jgi:hypothetical protein
MKKTHFVFCFIVLSVFACSIDDASKRISANTTLKSSDLTSGSPPSILRQNLETADCSGSADGCLTPDSVTGVVYYAGIQVGINGSGYSLGPIVGNITDPSPITSFPQEDLLNFDLGEQLTVAGTIVCCEGASFPEDSRAYARAIEIYFGYIDTTFTLSEVDGVAVDLVGTHTIRTVYGDIDGTDFKKGDLLYKGSGETDFKWCTPTEGCTLTTRPSTPIQYDTVVNYSGSEDGLGNQTIPIFSADLTTEEIQLTESEVLANSWTFTIDFDMTNGVIFTQDITEATQIYELVHAFQLAAEPGDSDNGFTATLQASRSS